MYIYGVIPFHFWMPERRKCGVCHFLHKIGCHGNIPWDIGKRGPDWSSARQALSHSKKTAKIGPVRLEIFDDIRRTQREHATQFWLECSQSKLLDWSSPKFLLDIVVLVALFNHAYTRRYPIRFLNVRATKVRSLPSLAQNWLPWQRPLRYRKKRFRSSICTQNAFIRWKGYENQSSGSWDNLSPRNHKKED